MRLRIAGCLVSAALLLGAGCRPGAEQSSSSAEPAKSGPNEMQIELTEEQAKTGAQARVTIPETRETVSVTVPPGIRDGMRLRLKGKGPPNADGTPGDFLIRIHVR